MKIFPHDIVFDVGNILLNCVVKRTPGFMKCSVCCIMMTAGQCWYQYFILCGNEKDICFCVICSMSHTLESVSYIPFKLTYSGYKKNQLLQFCCPPDVIGGIVRDDDNKATTLLSLFAFTLYLMMLSHTGGKLYFPPSLLRLGFRVLIYMASFTPLSNHLDSAIRISEALYVMGSWQGFFSFLLWCFHWFLWCFYFLF